MISPADGTRLGRPWTMPSRSGSGPRNSQRGQDVGMPTDRDFAGGSPPFEGSKSPTPGQLAARESIRPSGQSVNPAGGRDDNRIAPTVFSNRPVSSRMRRGLETLGCVMPRTAGSAQTPRGRPQRRRKPANAESAGHSSGRLRGTKRTEVYSLFNQWATLALSISGKNAVRV